MSFAWIHCSIQSVLCCAVFLFSFFFFFLFAFFFLSSAEHCDDRSTWRSQIHRKFSLPFDSISFSPLCTVCTLLCRMKNRIEYVINIVFVTCTEMKRPLTIVGYLDYWFDSVLRGVLLLLIVEFFFCIFISFFARFSCLVFVLLVRGTLFYFALCLFASLANFGVWCVNIWIEFVCARLTNSVVRCCVRCAAHGHVYVCNEQRHQVFNIRNKNEATTNARICYVYRIYRCKRYMWQIYVSSTISVTRLTLPLLLRIAFLHDFCCFFLSLSFSFCVYLL